MRVFVTGASGYLGSALVRAFVEAGHEVTGLHHPVDGERRVRELGAAPVQGDIGRPASYEAAARDHDVYVHAAFDARNPAVADGKAIESLLRLTGAGARGLQMVIYTSGCWVLGNTGTEPADEDAATDRPAPIVAWRPKHEANVLVAATRHVPTAVIRPGMVYGGTGGLVARLFETAVRDGATRFVGDGRNRWSLVHREDLARLYVRVAEKRSGGIFHGVDGRPLHVAVVARAASTAAGEGDTQAMSLDEARQELGAMADAMVLDQALVAPRAAKIGWQPFRRDFVAGAPEAFHEWRRSGSPPHYRREHLFATKQHTDATSTIARSSGIVSVPGSIE